MGDREAGRELDQRVAIEIMGWGWCARQSSKWLAPLSTIGYDDGSFEGVVRAARDDDEAEHPWWLEDRSRTNPPHDVVPHYSTSLVDAWLVVEKMTRGIENGDTWDFDLHYAGDSTEARSWRAGFQLWVNPESPGPWSSGYAEASTPAQASATRHE